MDWKNIYTKKKRHTKEEQQYSEIKPSLDKINNMSPDEIANLRKCTGLNVI